MTLKTFKRLDYAFGWIVFLISAVVYLMTIEPTVSFWDCGEFISSSNKLQVGHPPGAPFFMVLARIFALFASDVTQVAKMINSFSALASAFTIMFLYWSIVYFAKRMLAKNNEYTVGQTIAIIASGLVGSLAYTFSDTFWFSAVEGEVYALSSFFSAIVFWAMLKWSDCDDDVEARRWIILIALLVGMSIGVHLLNLLTIPAISFIFYFKKYRYEKLSKFITGIVITTIVSLLILSMIMWGIIPGVAVIASKFELFFVNSLGMSYNSGLVAWFIIVILTLAASIYVTQYNKNIILKVSISSLAFLLLGAAFISGNTFFNLICLLCLIVFIYFIARKYKELLNIIMICVTMVMIGYSSYAIIVIRSNANPPMNQNSPDDAFSLLYYLNREQYGDRPLVHGPYFDAKVINYENTSPVYVKRGGKYEIASYKPKTIYDERRCVVFPRMHSKEQEHIDVYKDFGGMKASQSEPRFSNNINFFLSYQMNWMFWRYFMWNFAGRQNDIQGNGNIIHGNWISGIKALDNYRLGDQDKLPDYLKENKANNKYYMLPLLLGLFGLAFQLNKHIKDWWIVFLFFVLTGIAIVVYLNQTPNQPRERDYAYAASFYAFSIWIGLGVLAIYELFKKFLPQTISASVAALLAFPIPVIMAKENWDDHDRSNRYIARDFAKNYLNSCAPNAILFTYGDNDTFPIWYAQEVEGVRTDIKVCCLPYFASDWYVDQMKCATYDAKPLPLTFDRPKYEPSVRDVLYYLPKTKTEDNNYISIDSLLNYIANDQISSFMYGSDKAYSYHKNKLFLRVDSTIVVNNGTVNPKDAHLISKIIKFDLNRSYMVKNEMMTLDLLRTNNWDRPIYFTSIGSSNTLGLTDYFQNEGFAYRLVPIKSNSRARIDTDIMYDNIMNKFAWGNMNDPNVVIDNTIARTTRVVRVRDNFKDLAIALVREGKVDSAKNVIARCDSIMPVSIFAPTYYELDYVNAYYAVGDTINGDAYLSEIVKVATQEIDFFISLKNELKQRSKYDMQLSIYTFQKAIQTAMTNKREKLKDEWLPRFEQYSAYF